MREQFRFLDLLDDRVVDRVEAGSPVVVLCPSWRDAAIGSRQLRCEGCDAFLGISARNWQYREEHPLTSAVLCLLCAAEFRRVYRERAEQRARRIREHAPQRRPRLKPQP